MPFGAPSLWFVSWYDVSTGPNLALFNHVRRNAKDPEVAENQFVVIAPTLHCAYKRAQEETIVGERNLGDARFDYDGLIYAWFDRWLKGESNGVLKRRHMSSITPWAATSGNLPKPGHRRTVKW